MLDATELAKRLREAMDNAKPPISSADLARACEVTPQAVNGWRKDGRIAKKHLRTIKAMTGRDILEPDAAEPASIMFSRGGLQQGRLPYGPNTSAGPERGGRVPLISWVQAGSFASAVDNLHPGDADEWVETTVPVHQHTYALRVHGDSMTNPLGDPTFPAGSIIVVEPDAIGNVAEMIGRFVIVKRNGDGEATFKQLVKDGAGLLLKPLNPQYPMLKFEETDEICGVVREKVMRFF